jgi:hypothetical protein
MKLASLSVVLYLTARACGHPVLPWKDRQRSFNSISKKADPEIKRQSFTGNITLPKPTIPIKDIPAPESPSKNKCDRTCICEVTDYYQIFFVNPNDVVVNRTMTKPDNATFPYYVISFNWLFHYPWQVTHALEKLGMVVSYGKDDKTVPTVPLCGWHRRAKASSKRVSRGSLYSSGTPGDDAVISNVYELLLAEYPFVEITFISSIILCPVALLFLCGFFVAMAEDKAWMGWWADWRKPRRSRLQSLHRSLRRTPELAQTRLSRLTRLVLPPRRPDNSGARLLQLPAELHYEIVSWLNFQDRRNLRRSSVYFSHLIRQKELDAQREAYIQAAVDSEAAAAALGAPGRAHRPVLKELFCSGCMVMRPTKMFERQQHKIEAKARLCARCEIKAFKWKDGAVACFNEITNPMPGYITGSASKTIQFCGSCRKSSPGLASMSSSVGTCLKPTWCPACTIKKANIKAWSNLLRLFIVVFVIIMWGIIQSSKFGP